MKIENRNQIPALIDSNRYKIVAEIGTLEGEFLSVIAKSNATEIWSIDLWQECPENMAKNDSRASQDILDKMYCNILEIAKIDPRIHVLRKDSQVAHMDFNDKYFDLIYIDADHSYNGIKADLYNWWPKVNNGGMLCGHDYIEHFLYGANVEFGVIPAVNEFVKANHAEDRFFVTPERWASWFILKE